IGIARKFGVGKTRSAVTLMIGSNVWRRQKTKGARGRDDIILIDAVPAHTNRTDEHTVPIERKSPGKNRNAIRNCRVRLIQRICATSFEESRDCPRMSPGVGSFIMGARTSQSCPPNVLLG